MRSDRLDRRAERADARRAGLADRDRPSQRIRIVAHEFRDDTPEQNQQHAAARLQALRAALQARGVDLARIDFIAAGSERNGSSLSSPYSDAALSRVDLLSGT